MSIHKNEKRGTWLASVRYTTWDGQRKQKKKEGFKTKKEALAWEQGYQIFFKISEITQEAYDN